jgi:heptosyltransferase-2
MVSRFPEAKEPRSILVLRNNDLGDLVIVTPLFQALRAAFPNARIVVAVGPWAKDILKNNPYISEVVECNAPWNNHHAGPRSLVRPLKYIFSSPEMARFKAENFDACIDVVGSIFGSMFMIKLGIPTRVGRKGYGGGHTGATAFLENTFTTSVSEGAVSYVRLLKQDAKVNFDLRPQLFLDGAEIEEAEKVWKHVEGADNNQRPRIVVAPAAGIPEKQWPTAMFADLVRRLAKETCGCVLGSPDNFEMGESIVQQLDGWSNRCGRASIRQSMAIISMADLVICPPTFSMHLAAAFNKPCVLILPAYFDPKEHAFYWEIKGVHHQLFPRNGEKHVQVVDVENMATSLLRSLREKEVTNLGSDLL